MPPPSRAASRPCAPFTRPACAPPASSRPSFPASRTCPPSSAAPKTSAISSGWKTSTCAAATKRPSSTTSPRAILPRAPLRGHLHPRRPRLLGGAGRGSARLRRRRGPALRARRRFHPPPLRGPAAGGQLLLPRGDHPLRQAREGAKRPKIETARPVQHRARGTFWGKDRYSPLRSTRTRTRSSLALLPNTSCPCSMKRSTTSASALSA